MLADYYSSPSWLNALLWIAFFVLVAVMVIDIARSGRR
jgi:hypothetical protein